MTKQIYTLIFDNITQQQIFFLLLNTETPIERNIIAHRLNIARTTIYDNIIKLMKRKINNLPYIRKMFIQETKKGRPKTFYYIPKILKKKFFTMIIVKTTNNYNIKLE